ncbi:MAG: HAMP domain-containing histidine kinase [Treponema sp.]|nr:HAMP domain-containing sensor histidine kinase [Treponema sp.]MCR5218803.1 HAMP domain-containing histidine kinase [Treponema sp.]
MTAGVSVSLLFAAFFLIFNIYIIGSNYADTDTYFDSISPENFFPRYLDQPPEFNEIRDNNVEPSGPDKENEPMYDRFRPPRPPEFEDDENEFFNRKGPEKGFPLRDTRPYEYRDHFVAHVDQEGTILLVFHEFSQQQSLDEDQVEALIKRMMKEGRIQNYNFEGYAYRFASHGNGFSIVIIDRRSEIYNEEHYAWMSLFIFLIAAAAVFILSWKFTWGALATAEESYSSQKRFIADASHELKTPISVIGANIDVLEQEIPDNKWLEYIKTENTRMSTLVKDLLYLAKNDAGQIEYSMMPFDLVNACACSVLAFESLAFEQKKRLELETPEEKIIINGDEAKIRQVIIILTDNALKNSDVNALIKVSCYVEGDYACIRVWNSGHGISQKDIPKIFDRFFRSDVSRSRVTGGSGLGLPIALSIAEYHGGTITVESEENEYAVFILKIPLERYN